MSNPSKLDFIALDVSEKVYFSCILDLEIHLRNSMELRNTIKEGSIASLRIVLKQLFLFATISRKN